MNQSFTATMMLLLRRTLLRSYSLSSFSTITSDFNLYQAQTISEPHRNIGT